ncbi:hypothetical protein V5N11_003706 [Cardamine amara subsp. amara]|uniref:Avr9/Cf-9 rapidly elicited protein n=1 Tax=Cardamine amara subsp. amara TaxID=228776 RepID=A0ABD1BZ14_CARAN
MNSLFSMLDSFCAQIMRSNVPTSNSSSNGPSASSSGTVQAMAIEKTTKKVLVKKAPRFAPELDGLHCFETIITSS